MDTTYLHFHAYTREGSATAIDEPDDLSGSLPLRTSLSLQITLNNDTGLRATRDINLLGPGDVLGINPSQIVRQEPSPNETNVEPNYFCHVEFSAPELPWQFTPASADNKQRLRPWMVLVVVRVQQGVELSSAAPLPILSINSPANCRQELPSLEESHAWAHIQSIGSHAVATPDSVAKHLSVSRLICPRRLVKHTRYIACVVPAFDAGVAAGLGLDFNENTIAAAWDDNTDSIRLPVYHSWQFSTGDKGDFESLIGQIKPSLPPPEALRGRQMYVGRAGAGLTELDLNANSVVPWESALQARPPTAEQRANSDIQSDLESSLEGFVNLGGKRVLSPAGLNEQQSSILSAPLYARWSGGRHLIPSQNSSPRWMRTLNISPTTRAAAGVGVRLVQVNQEIYVRQAWQQIGAVKEANARIRRNRMAGLIGERIKQRHIEPRNPVDLLQFISPMSRRLRLDQESLYHRIANSRLTESLIDPAFRKAFRPQAKLVRHLETTQIAEDISTQALTLALEQESFMQVNETPLDGAIGASLLNELRNNTGLEGSLVSLPDAEGLFVARELVEGILQANSMGSGAGIVGEVFNKRPPVQRFGMIRERDSIAFSLAGIAGVSTGIETPVEASLKVMDSATGSLKSLDSTLRLRTQDGQEYLGQTPLTPQLSSTLAMRSFQLARTSYTGSALLYFGKDTRRRRLLAIGDSTAFNGVPQYKRLYSRDYKAYIAPQIHVILPNDSIFGRTQSYSASRIAFSEATKRDLAGLVAVADKPETATDFDLLATNTQILTAIDPQVFALKRLDVEISGWGQQEDPRSQDFLAQPIFAAPNFPEPLVYKLAELNPDFILPGLKNLDNNSVTAVATNPRFIESLMIGANHEIGSELTWRGYPTDRRATCFRRFWDRESADIPAIHTWQLEAELGHSLAGSGQSELVIAIRGDLLRRFPNMVIGIAPAEWADDGERTLSLPLEPPQFMMPIFSADLQPDIALRGFNIASSVARGQTERPENSANVQEGAGYYLVFTEAMGAPRFGLDVFSAELNLASLAWNHMPENSSHARFNAFGHSGRSFENGLFHWGGNSDSANMAALTFQQAMIVYVHIDEMLVK
ncbi:MAG: hypothetical protein GQ582_00265 [Methyloprofundus sp.]|nr:hypothetical protein [Methyloprofundus sp.]